MTVAVARRGAYGTLAARSEAVGRPRTTAAKRADARWRGWLADRGWSPARPNDLATAAGGAARDVGLPWEAALSEALTRCLEW